MSDPWRTPIFVEVGVIWIAGTLRFVYILCGIIRPEKGNWNL